MNDTGTIHSPTLINAEAMAEDHPKTFARPSELDIADIELRDHVKVAMHYMGGEVKLHGHSISGERFWLEVVMKSSDYWIGQCKSKLLFDGIKPGDLVKFHPCNIYDICKHEEES